MQDSKNKVMKKIYKTLGLIFMFTVVLAFIGSFIGTQLDTVLNIKPYGTLIILAASYIVTMIVTVIYLKKVKFKNDVSDSR